MCIFMLTQQNLTSILCDLHRKKVQIRIITDGAEDEVTSSQIHNLASAGIIIKSNKANTGALMHHKFVVIDDELLICGSFNWTNKAVVSNYEAVVVTSNRSLVRPFITEFHKMWSSFELFHGRSMSYDECGDLLVAPLAKRFAFNKNTSQHR